MPVEPQVDVSTSDNQDLEFRVPIGTSQVSIQASASLSTGTAVVATTGIAVAIGSGRCDRVDVMAMASNVGTVVIGASNVSFSGGVGMMLAPGADAPTLEISRLDRVFIDAQVAGEGVVWIAQIP